MSQTNLGLASANGDNQIHPNNENTMRIAPELLDTVPFFNLNFPMPRFRLKFRPQNNQNRPRGKFVSFKKYCEISRRKIKPKRAERGGNQTIIPNKANIKPFSKFEITFFKKEDTNNEKKFKFNSALF